MYCHVIYADCWGSSADEKSIATSEFKSMNSTTAIALTNKTLTINPDCYVQILIEYVRNIIKLQNSDMFDFCDEYGKLLKIYTLKEYDYATKVLKHKWTYIIVLYKRDEVGKIMKIEPVIHKTSKLITDICIRLSRNLKRRKGAPTQRKRSSDSGIGEDDPSLLTLTAHDVDVCNIETFESNKSIRSLKKKRLFKNKDIARDIL